MGEAGATRASGYSVTRERADAILNAENLDKG
jgi:hypothetical protein